MKNIQRTPSHSLKRWRGQALVEFALALPLVVFLVLGALEFGRAFQTKIVLENAAREGVHNFIYDIDDASNSFNNTKAAVVAEAANSGVTILSDKIVVQCFTDTNGNGSIDSGEEDPGCDNGSTVDVTIIVDFDIAVIGPFTDPMPISSNARMFIP